jgi:SAM-dependent methyltransferase
MTRTPLGMDSLETAPKALRELHDSIGYRAHMDADLVAQLLVQPGSLAPLRLEGNACIAPDGERYLIEDGIVRTLRNVDPDLALELQAQERAVDDYADPDLLMPRYERDMARLALIQLFGGKPPSGTILDAGCGIGLLGRLYPDLGLIGLDVSMPLLTKAGSGYRLLVEGSAEALPFPNQTFDVVVALNMLHHVINPDAAVREFARVLKPGGMLVTVDPRKVGVIELAKRALRGKDQTFAPSHKAFRVDEYERIIRQGALFRIEERQLVGLITLVTMGGLDALRLSKVLPAPDTIANMLRSVDRLLFKLPGVCRLGLNIAVRGQRAVTSPAS